MYRILKHFVWINKKGEEYLYLKTHINHKSNKNIKYSLTFWFIELINETFVNKRRCKYRILKHFVWINKKGEEYLYLKTRINYKSNKNI